MNLLILGSTGGTGRELLKQALEQGHDAVVCAIGACAQRTTLREDGTRILVEAMEKTG